MSSRAPAEVDAGAGAVVVHVTRIEPRPLVVSDKESSERVLGLPWRKQTFRALNVPIVALPNGRWAVEVRAVEEALRRVSTPTTRDASPQTSSDDALLAAAGLRRVAGGRR